MIKVIVGILASIVVVAGAWHFMSKSSSEATTAPTQAAGLATSTALTPTITTPTTGQAGSGNIGSLLAMSGSVMCTVTVSAAGTQSSGTIYVSNGKMHGDFTMNIAGKTMHASMINDGAYMYSWSDMIPQGVKIPISAAASTGDTTHGFGNSTPVSYNCSPWTTDASKFVPPSNISFMTIPGGHR